MAEKVVLDAAVRKYAEAKKQIAALKVAIKQADKENAEILKGMKEEKTRETMAVHVRKIAKEEQKLVIQRLRQTHARSNAQLATQEAQLSEIEKEVRQLKRPSPSANTQRQITIINNRPRLTKKQLVKSRLSLRWLGNEPLKKTC